MTPRPNKRIAILQPQDELREPCEKTFSSLGITIDWFTSLEDLLGSPPDDPSVVLIDLDCLRDSLRSKLQQIRFAFPNSDRIALSGSDSSQLALDCIRSGFTDFLLKPSSPEEIAWSVRRCQQRQEMMQRYEEEDPQNDFARSVNQISAASSPTLVRLYTLEFLQGVLHCEGASWINLVQRTAPEILLVSPKRFNEKNALDELPEKLPKNLVHPLIRKGESESLTLLLPCQDYPAGAILLWGIRSPLTTKILNNCKLLLEHADLCLLNLQKMEDLKQQTFIDDLTGLYNSRFLKYAVTVAIQKCRDPSSRFSVLFIDVDHFKKVNDTNNHLVGSEFLIAIGRTIRNAIRGVDPVFRYGGDEFVVLLNETGTEEAKEIAERIRKNIERRIFVIQGCRLRTTVSIGVATYPIHAKERETLLKMADEAMFSVKKASRNAVHLALPPR